MTTTRKGSSPYETPAGASSGGDNKMAWIIGGAVAVVVVIIGLIVILSGNGDSGGDAVAGTGAAAAKKAKQETAPVQISGEDLPVLSESGLVPAGSDPAVGMPAPKVVGQSFDESVVTIDPGDGTPKMLVFLASWCGHCQAEVPALQDWIDSGDVPENLEIIGVSTIVDQSRPNYPPSNWLASEGWTPQVLLDDDANSVGATYGLSGTPYFVMIDADGKVWQRGSGEIPVANFQTLVDELATGQSQSSGGSGEGGEEETPVSLPGTEAEG